jgi:DNA replication and repair protein RecF
VLFSPEDLYLIKGPASGRRDFLDGAISQIRPRYGDLLARYEKLLDSKSRLLKMEEPRPSAELIAAYDDQLAHIGAHLMGYRAKFCRGLGEECGNMHAAISGGKETLTLQYKTVSTVTDPFAEPSVIEGQLRDHLESHRLAELQSGSCLSGLHKDDMELDINGRPARAFASQGQTRSAALALKFGQRELFSGIRENIPCCCWMMCFPNWMPPGRPLWPVTPWAGSPSSPAAKSGRNFKTVI